MTTHRRHPTIPGYFEVLTQHAKDYFEREGRKDFWCCSECPARKNCDNSCRPEAVWVTEVTAVAIALEGDQE